MNEDMKVLFCDIDDVIIDSATQIQHYVENYTVFTTDVLSRIEQFKRNCQYYYDCVKDECMAVLKENRKPDFQKFPNMEGVFTAEKALLIARDYLKDANDILEQFLEERDMFLELDNLPLYGTKNYDFDAEKQKIDAFKNRIRSHSEALRKINEFCLSEARRISNEARNHFSNPNYKALVKMDKNDIIRTNDEDSEDYSYRIYDKPCLDIEECLKESVIDYALENFNIEKEMSRAIVNYDTIYVLNKINSSAVLALCKIMNSGTVDELCFITHHNGDREIEAKKRMIKAMLLRTNIDRNRVDFIGMRFHSEEHNLERRYRSSKYDTAKKKYSMIKPENMILLDDSKANCDDWNEKQGKVIIYRRITDAEKVSGLETFDYPRIASFDYLENTMYNMLEKQKVKKLGGK